MIPLKIIAIEDDQDFGELLMMTLTAWGHDVTLKRNWLSMMKVLGAESFDVIVADIETPTGNSLTALEFLNSDEKVRSTPKIFVSGLNDRQTKMSCESLNAGYIHKSPRVFDELKSMLAEHMKQHIAVAV